MKPVKARTIIITIFKRKKIGGSLTFWRLRIRVSEHLVLVTKHVVVDVEFVCNGPLEEEKTTSTRCSNSTQHKESDKSTHLRRQHEGLHELPHGLHVVGQLAHHLHHHALVQGGVGVHVPDLGVTIAETQSHDPLMDLLRRRRKFSFLQAHLQFTSDYNLSMKSIRSKSVLCWFCPFSLMFLMFVLKHASLAFSHDIVVRFL